MVVLMSPSTQAAEQGVGLRCQRESSLTNRDQHWSWAEAAHREMKEGIAMNSEEIEGSMVEQRDRGMTLVIQLKSVKNKTKQVSVVEWLSRSPHKTKQNKTLKLTHYLSCKNIQILGC